MPELLSTRNRLSLIGYAIKRLTTATTGVRVKQDELIAFAYNASVEARDRGAVNNYIVRWITTDVKDLLVKCQLVNLFFMIGIRADL
jgi:hypothetical protein